MTLRDWGLVENTDTGLWHFLYWMQFESLRFAEADWSSHRSNSL
jgi:hypothetical protein